MYAFDTDIQGGSLSELQQFAKLTLFPSIPQVRGNLVGCNRICYVNNIGVINDPAERRGYSFIQTVKQGNSLIMVTILEESARTLWLTNRLTQTWKSIHFM